MNAPPLQLRDIHLPPEPGWWPPAPGWWLLAALLLLLIAWSWRQLRRRLRQKRRAQALEEQVSRALAPATADAQLALLSQLLRRAARQADPGAATLHGEDWLRFLDGDAADRPFSTGAGRILLEGPFRTGTEPVQIARLLPVLRARYLQLLGAGA